MIYPLPYLLGVFEEKLRRRAQLRHDGYYYRRRPSRRHRPPSGVGGETTCST